eukprot:c11773_g1_i1.p2 GENE.c11773_g1_i1~~c11773_g1_i1.p2  ORF type:complete len:316 (-),score=82.69 c11773_g1_i1:1497-2381(-)
MILSTCRTRGLRQLVQYRNFAIQPTTGDISEKLSGGGVKLTGTKIRRTYQHVGVREHASGGFEVVLDGRAVVTPTKKKMILPTKMLANAIAFEWDIQGQEIKHQSMLMTTLAATAIDDVQQDQMKYVREIIKYIETDSVCIRNTYPEGLVRSQRQHWDPLVEFVKRHYKKAPLVTTELVLFDQNHELINEFHDIITNFDPFTTIAVHSIVATSKSLILALGLLHEAITARDAADAALVEEKFQIEQNGLVQGYHDVFLAKTHAKIAAAAMFLKLLQQPTTNAATATTTGAGMSA